MTSIMGSADDQVVLVAARPEPLAVVVAFEARRKRRDAAENAGGIRLLSRG